MPCVYLLHIDPPLGHARHYVGFSTDDDPCRRVEMHRKGAGSKMLRAAVRSGRKLTLVHFWTGADRKFEAWLHKRRDASKWCPSCGGSRPLPTAEAMSERFHNGKADHEVRRKRSYEVTCSAAE